jgi:glycosyltransferase involved in cell wall biosynthesis
MKFSVLMPVYRGDHAEYVNLAIASILNQTRLPDEIVIIVDGEIGEDIQSVLDHYAEEHQIFQIIHLPENKGLGDALQIGVNQCRFDLIARMDADDICREDRFEKQISFLEDHPDIDVVGSYIYEFDKSPEEKNGNIRNVPILHKEIESYSKRRNPLNHMTVVYRKNAVLEAGNYQKFLWFEDYNLWVRMILSGKKFRNIPDALVFARTGHDMYMRRGGFQYLLNDVKLQCVFFKMGHTSAVQYITNVIARSIVRIVPNQVRSKMYTGLLRK